MKKIYIILFIAVLLPLVSSFDFTNGGKSYYNLNEISGDAIDRLFFTNNMTNNGSTQGETGISGTAYNFTRANGDYLNVTGSLGIGAYPWSMQAWVNTATPGSGIELTILAFGSTSNDNIDYSFGVSSSNNLFILARTGAGLDFSASSTSINDSDWHHIVMTADSATDRKLYSDGISILNQTISISFLTTDIVTYVGSSVTGGGAPGNNWNGAIDELAYWNRTLNVSEVRELYNNGTGEFLESFLVVTLDSPVNGTKISDIGTNFTATYNAGSFNLVNATYKVFKLNGSVFELFNETTVNVTGVLNTTTQFIDSFTVGEYLWNVEACSTNGTEDLCNQADTNNSFSVSFSILGQDFNEFTNETQSETFAINISTFFSILSVTADFLYNGTSHPGTVSCTGNDCEIETTFDIPLIPSVPSTNFTGFWNITLFDGTTSFNSDTQSELVNQDVSRIFLEQCNATFTVNTLNFTAAEERTLDAVSPFDFGGVFDIWLGTGEVKRSSNFSLPGASNVGLCLGTAGDYFLDAQIDYDDNSTNFTKRQYFFQNDSLSDTVQEIILYLLEADKSTSFILKVQDDRLLPLANRLIEIQRFFPGLDVFKTVQIARTDGTGESVGFFEAETVDYRFLISFQNETILTSAQQPIVGKTSPFTLTFTIGADPGKPWRDLELPGELIVTHLFNRSTNSVNFTYIDTSGNFTSANLLVQVINLTGSTQETICNVTSSQPSASLSCDIFAITNDTNRTYVSTATIIRTDQTVVDSITFSIGGIAEVLGIVGAFLGWFLILIAAFAFRFNEIAGIFMINISVIFVNIIGLVSFGGLAISALIAVSIIIVAVMER